MIHNRFKSIFLGDFNATVGMDSRNSGVWDGVLGFINSSNVKTNVSSSKLSIVFSEQSVCIVVLDLTIHRAKLKDLLLYENFCLDLSNLVDLIVQPLHFSTPIITWLE